MHTDVIKLFAGAILMLNYSFFRILGLLGVSSMSFDESEAVALGVSRLKILDIV